MIKVLEIGPSPYKSKGGMATVIKEIVENKKCASENLSIEFFESYRDGSRLYRFIFCVFQFVKFRFVYKRYDLFHLHSASYGSAFRKAKYINFLTRKNKKVILHIHGAEFEQFFQELPKKRKLFLQKSFGNPNCIIALSEHWKKIFQNFFPKQQIEVINNSINLDNLKGSENSIDNTIGNFLFLGRVGERKGVYDLLKVAQRLVEENYCFKIFIAGDGEVENASNLVKKYKLEEKVFVIGWVDQKKKIELLNKSSVLVLPSYNEGLPMSILEAMACGKTVISTYVGGIPEVVKEENGFLIMPGDINKLFNCMVRCIEDKKMLEKISKINKNKIALEYDSNIIHKQIWKLIKSQINEMSIDNDKKI